MLYRGYDGLGCMLMLLSCWPGMYCFVVICSIVDCICCYMFEILCLRFNLNIALRTCNTTYNQLCDRSPQNKINSSGIYRLQCKTCNKSYVGQTGKTFEIRHREHI